MRENSTNYLDGKVVAITGAGGYICSAIARELAGAGARVALIDYKREGVERVAEDIRACGGIAEPYVANVMSERELVAVHEDIIRDIGRVHILINGAGGNNPAATCEREYADGSMRDDFFSLDIEGVKSVFDLNFIGTFLPTKVFCRDMVGVEGTNILNISSMNAYRPLTKIPAYSGAKAAVSNFTMWLAVHFAKVGVRVNAIAPGFFVTSQNRALLYDREGRPTERTEKILSATPMARFGNVEELLGAVTMLIDSSKASFVTGVVLPIDGGFSAYSGV